MRRISQCSGLQDVKTSRHAVGAAMSDRSATAKKYAVASDITQFTRGPMDGDRGCDFVVGGIKTGNDAGFDESTWFDGCYEPGPAGTEVASPPASAASAPAAASASPGTDWPETQSPGPLLSHEQLRRLHFDAERRLIEQALAHRFIRVCLDVFDVSEGCHSTRNEQVERGQGRARITGGRRAGAVRSESGRRRAAPS